MEPKQVRGDFSRGEDAQGKRHRKEPPSTSLFLNGLLMVTSLSPESIIN